MGKIAGAPPINESIALLERHNPGAIQAIRREHPEAAEILRLGMLAGTPDVDDILLISLKVAHAGLVTSLSLGRQALRSLSIRIRRGERIGVIAQLAVGASGALAIFSPLWVDRVLVVQVLLALIWASGLAGLVASRHFHRSALGRSTSWSLHQELTTLCSQARTLLSLVPVLQAQRTAERMTAAISEANVLAQRIAEVAAEESYESVSSIPPRGDIEPLVALLSSLFPDPEELGLWVTFLPDGAQLACQLPEIRPGTEPQTPRLGYYRRVVAMLAAYGLVDSDLFIRLCNRYPRRAKEIMDISSMFEY